MQFSPYWCNSTQKDNQTNTSYPNFLLGTTISTMRNANGTTCVGRVSYYYEINLLTEPRFHCTFIQRNRICVAHIGDEN